MPASTVLLLDTDRLAAESIGATLTGAGYEVTTVIDPDEAFRRAAEFSVVVIDEVHPRPAVEVCREIRTTPSLAPIPVLCISQTDDVEERVRFLEAGPTTSSPARSTRASWRRGWRPSSSASGGAATWRR